MNRRKWITLGVSVLVIILFAIVILTAFNFKKDREEVFEDYTNNELPNESDETIFHNSSDLTEEEIRTLVEEKRTSLKDVIENAQYYKASDVSSSFNREDDEKVVAIPESFLNKIKNLLTTNLYSEYTKDVKAITVDKNITNITEPLYEMPKDLFDNASFNSAISFYDVSEENLILENATNDKITTIINIKLCEENTDDNCTRDSYYRFILEKEQEEWKIADFETEM